MFRPTTLSEIVGQKQVRENLSILIRSCKINDEPLPHILLTAVPGSGKTTLCQAVANDMGSAFIATNAASIRTYKNLLLVLSQITSNCILFIDEIHRLPPIVEELLYNVLEDGYLLHNAEKTVLPPFTVIAATTNPGQLNRPLLDRFTIKEQLDPYTEAELSELCITNFKKAGLSVDSFSSYFLARISRGSPRILNNFIQWLKHCCTVQEISRLTLDKCRTFIKMRGVDDQGLTKDDYKYLSVLKSADRPLGLSSIVSQTGIDQEHIQYAIEPYLLKLGKITLLPKGRILCGSSTEQIKSV